ncbi:hypothetical protein BD310DRAFT_373813 [Dichomitus squalens]|uniref:Uncharacterized protein n=1 Tax=Dichomitus squalens TaxID=114155 RepID=A0A4Q9PYE9_9APHY|nr:hypothetical protein BD310DRAFT_373813 [Dichomitus squalens]
MIYAGVRSAHRDSKLGIWAEAPRQPNRRVCPGIAMVAQSREGRRGDVRCWHCRVMAASLEGTLKGGREHRHRGVCYQVVLILFTLLTFQNVYVAMASSLGVQKRAQAEPHAVVGPHRLLTFADSRLSP